MPYDSVEKKHEHNHTYHVANREAILARKRRYWIRRGCDLRYGLRVDKARRRAEVNPFGINQQEHSDS